MRRPQTAFGLAAVMSSLLVASLLPAPVSAARAPAEPETTAVFDAPARCTKWSNQRTPPKTIRVLRSKRDKTPKKVAGTVQEVNFRDYVATTMAVEWPEHYPLETLKAGAIATKQFSWYYIVNPRGKTKKIDGKKVCYDVSDTSIDQYYYPERYGVGQPSGPGPRIDKALAATWDISLRKFSQKSQSSRMFLTGYRAGSTSVCGADKTGYKLFHHSTKQCGKEGKTFREILKIYLNPRLEIVTPGRRDVIGTKSGDAAAMVKKDTGQLSAHVWTPNVSPPEPGSFAGINLSTSDLVGYRSSDVDDDGKDDLVWLKKTGNKSGRLRVAISDGTNFGADQTWFDGDTTVPLDGARLLVGDFNANGRRDAAILAKGTEAGKAKLIVFKKKSGNSFSDPILWWSGSLNINDVHSAWAADITGDGRADLVVRLPVDGGGVRIKTAVGKSPSPGMGGLMTRFQSTTMKSGKTKMVATDANRDGRDDLLMVVGGRGPAKVERLQGQGGGGFKRVKIWTSPKSDPIPVSISKLTSADMDYDGRGDLIVFSKKGSDTRMRVLKTGYDRMNKGPNKTISTDWDKLRTY